MKFYMRIILQGESKAAKLAREKGAYQTCKLVEPGGLQLLLSRVLLAITYRRDLAVYALV